MKFELDLNMTVFQRGWLSSNNILVQGEQGTALIDSGYCIHAPQTVALVGAALKGRPLDLLVNTHLHSDHCGGNAALQAHYPSMVTRIPPGLARHVEHWDAHALTYIPTGQQCPPFRMDATLMPGTDIRLGDLDWQIHAAPGHDTHSVILFEPKSRTLVSADALWQNGFGVVFPELDGEQAFDEVGATLDLIEQLRPAVVIPGHGEPFDDAPHALATARQRLAGFVQNPAKHLRYAAKVLLKFKLLELQSIETQALIDWAQNTPYFAGTITRQSGGLPMNELATQLIDDLVRSGAARVQGSLVINA